MCDKILFSFRFSDAAESCSGLQIIFCRNKKTSLFGARSQKSQNNHFKMLFNGTENNNVKMIIL